MNVIFKNHFNQVILSEINASSGPKALYQNFPQFPLLKFVSLPINIRFAIK